MECCSTSGLKWVSKVGTREKHQGHPLNKPAAWMDAQKRVSRS